MVRTGRTRYADTRRDASALRSTVSNGRILIATQFGKARWRQGRGAFHFKQGRGGALVSCQMTYSGADQIRPDHMFVELSNLRILRGTRPT
jgi:hypothetical protein